MLLRVVTPLKWTAQGLLDITSARSQMNGQFISCSDEPSSADLKISTRTVEVCKKHDIMVNCLARQVSTSDFIDFTHILAADQQNLENLLRIRPDNATAVVRLWGSYLDNKPIPDPYYGRKVTALCQT